MFLWRVWVGPGPYFFRFLFLLFLFVSLFFVLKWDDLHFLSWREMSWVWCCLITECYLLGGISGWQSHLWAWLGLTQLDATAWHRVLHPGIGSQTLCSAYAGDSVLKQFENRLVMKTWFSSGEETVLKHFFEARILLKAWSFLIPYNLCCTEMSEHWIAFINCWRVFVQWKKNCTSCSHKIKYTEHLHSCILLLRDHIKHET